MREQLDLQSRGQDLAEKQNIQLYGGVGPGGEKVEGIKQREIGIAEAQQQAQQTPATKPLKASDIMSFQAKIYALNKTTNGAVNLQKATQPLLNRIKQMQEMNPDLNRIDVYRELKSPMVWDSIKRPILEKLEKDYQQATEAGDKVTAEGVMDLYDAVKSGTFLDSLMPHSARHEQQLKAAMEIERMKATKASKLYETTEGWLPAGKAVGKLKPQKGWELTTDSEGNVSIKQTALGGAGGLTKPVQTDLQKGVIEDKEALDKLRQIIYQFQPKFQTLPFRAGAEWESFKQRWLGKKPDPETDKELKAFKTWHKKAMRDYGIAVQALGKGNLTKNEEKIYGAGLPQPGKGLIPKDAPGVYWDAIKDRYAGLRAAVARKNYYLQQGLTESQYKIRVSRNEVKTLEEMEEIIGKEIEDLVKENSGKGLGTDIGSIMQRVLTKYGL
jgi:hypothetical protein